MRTVFILLLVSIVLGACSSTKIVPTGTHGIAPPPPPSSMPPVAEEKYKRIDYADSSDRGALNIQPTGSNTLVLQHLTIGGQLSGGQGHPALRLIIWQQNGEKTEHPLTISVKDGGYVYDNDVMHRLQPGQHAIVEVFDPVAGEIYPAKIKATGFQETK